MGGVIWHKLLPYPRHNKEVACRTSRRAEVLNHQTAPTKDKLQMLESFNLNATY